MEGYVIYGGCASIIVDPNDSKIVHKIFCRPGHAPQANDTNCLILECIVTKHFLDSQYIVKFKGFDLRNKKMFIERWPYSLSQAFKEFDWTITQKHIIFRDIVYGLCNLQLRGIIHADIKINNILYNPKGNRACLCDLGISSIIKYANINAACKEIQPSNNTLSTSGERVIGRDMFALCMLAMKLFMGIDYTVGKSMTPLELRDRINKSNVKIKSLLKNVMLKMIPDDISNSCTAMDVLGELYGEQMSYQPPIAKVYPNVRVTEEDKLFIESTMLNLCEKYNIHRGNRCYNSLINYLNRLDLKPVHPKYYDAYIAASLLIYSSLFNDSHLYIDKSYDLISSDISRTEYETIISNIMMDDDFCLLALYPYST